MYYDVDCVHIGTLCVACKNLEKLGLFTFTFWGMILACTTTAVAAHRSCCFCVVSAWVRLRAHEARKTTASTNDDEKTNSLHLEMRKRITFTLKVLERKAP